MLLALAGRGRAYKGVWCALEGNTEAKRCLARHAVPSKRRKSGSNQDKSHPVVDEAHVNDYVSDSAEALKAVTLPHKRMLASTNYRTNLKL